MKLLTIGTAILFLGVVGLAVVEVNTINSLHSLEGKLALVQGEQAKAREAIDAEAAKLRDSAAASEAQRQKALDSVRDEVEKAKRQASGVAGKVKEEALKSVDDLTVRVNSSEAKLKENHDSTARVASEITGLKQATDATQSNINAVSAEVSVVKTDVANTRIRLDSTIADLRRTTGDMNVMSGLIATNAKEVDALRQLGDRTYVDFTIFKRNDPVRLADITILLKKTDLKANRYTIEMQVSDRKIEKKDRTVNEPLQFYTNHDLQPHELVVNQVGKDQIVGYLAIPKATASRPNP
jgi:chromosome segregation ATPase